jgi:hypothetical protein
MKKCVLVLVTFTFPTLTHCLLAQGTAFTYQGQLQQNGSPANGSYDLQFILYNASVGGSQAGPILTNSATAVSNGLFTMTLDFGEGIFTGTNYWLDIAVRSNGAGTFAELSPRQPLTPAPYAVFAGTSSNLSGTVSVGQLNGTVGNSQLAHNSITLTAGTGLSGGGTVALGGATTLTNAGVLSVTGNPDITATNAGGAVTLGDTATSSNAVGTLVKRNASGNFAAGTISATSFSGAFNGNGNGLTNLNASQLAGGVVPTNMLSGFQPPNYNTISGGFGNNAAGFGAFIGGGEFNAATNQYATVGGGNQNTAGGPGATVAGGFDNIASAQTATIGGGYTNTVSSYSATVAGGQYNSASGDIATVGGGAGNSASGSEATVAGGLDNLASGADATVSGGADNAATADFATVLGGKYNGASGINATVAGGGGNNAAGDYSFAAGSYAGALHQGSFVWADSQTAPFNSTANDQFAVRASGGIRLAGDVELDSSTYHHLWLSGGNSTGYLYGSYPALGDGVHLGYNYYYDADGNGHVLNTGGGTSRLTVGYGFISLNVGGVAAAPATQRLLANSSGVTVNGTFNNSSDRNAKQDFAPVNPARILQEVAQLPVSEWSYKEDAATRHIGPMGQDFYAAFNIGTDEKHIAPIDEGGVALAAIQGLNRKVDDKEARIQEQAAEINHLKQQNNSLAARLNELEATVRALAEKK